MDTIRVYDEDGQEVEKELVLLMELEERSYILFRDIEGKNKKMYASYFYSDELDNGAVNLINDLSEEEYAMLEEAYKKGKDFYDREK